MDVWAVGDAYERYMGRWSRLVAARFVAWIDAPRDLRWIDVGCGTGALAFTISAACRPRRLLGVDRSAAFAAAGRGADASTRYVVADSAALPVPAASCDAAVSGLMLNFAASPIAAVAEQVRAVRPGGLVAAYVWDYAEGMLLLRHFWDAAVAVDPSAGGLDEGRRFPICRPDRLHALWSEASLAHVAVTPLEVPMVFPGFRDLWEPFLGGQGPAPGYLAQLDPSLRDRLRDTLRERLPIRQDGSIALTARAWAVQGRRPRI
jgi:SAM-dependent methyltransferase